MKVTCIIKSKTHVLPVMTLTFWITIYVWESEPQGIESFLDCKIWDPEQGNVKDRKVGECLWQNVELHQGHYVEQLGPHVQASWTK